MVHDTPMGPPNYTDPLYFPTLHGLCVSAGWDKKGLYVTMPGWFGLFTNVLNENTSKTLNKNTIIFKLHHRKK